MISRAVLFSSCKIGWLIVGEASFMEVMIVSFVAKIVWLIADFATAL